MTNNTVGNNQTEAMAGVALIVAALLALFMANTPLKVFYSEALALPVVVQLGDFSIAKPLLLWINDGLMAIFFFLVGLEIKREVLVGHLSSKDQIFLPAFAAIIGILMPALIYAGLSGGDSVVLRGWAIPSATDIAFAMGVFSLFGKRLPFTLKLFLLSVAIFDDIGAVIIIALFYSHDLSIISLVIALVGLSILLCLNRCRVRYQSAYLLIGLVIWSAVLKSGVHATLAGFLIAWFIPLNVLNPHGDSILGHLEHALRPWVSWFILPVFAFANVGVDFLTVTMADFFSPITLGIILGLFLGKQLGIFTACWLVVKSGIAKLPAGSNWLQLYGVSILCGIGFTMSLFIGTLAFEQQDPQMLNSVKLGVFMGSLLSAVLGAYIIARASPDASSVR